ncbi:MAG: hypothetical protein K1X79_06915 [Oligoflexia bacterium]|nr:hypothetical protein [Oligoflexia bacterium]
MADAGQKKLSKKVSFAGIHKLVAGTSLIAFLVIIGGGVMARASVFSIAFRAFIAIFVIGVVSRVLIRILASYEEMNSGKA